MKPILPTELFFGMIANQWPVYVFESEDKALHWIGQDPGLRYVWKATLTNVTSMHWIPPSRPRLTAEPPSGGTE